MTGWRRGKEGGRAWMAPSAWPETAQLDFDKHRAVTAEPPGLPQMADAPTEGGPSGAAGRPAMESRLRESLTMRILHPICNIAYAGARAVSGRGPMRLAAPSIDGSADGRTDDGR